MKRNSKGFAHHVALMAIIVVAVVGGIGSYIYLKDSSAATISSITIQPGDWKAKKGADKVTDGGSLAMRINRLGSSATHVNGIYAHNDSNGTYLAKLSNFNSLNKGKKARACMKVRATTSGVTARLYLVNGTAINSREKTVTIKTSYANYCIDYTVGGSKYGNVWVQHASPKYHKVFVRNVTLKLL